LVKEFVAASINLVSTSPPSSASTATAPQCRRPELPRRPEKN